MLGVYARRSSGRTVHFKSSVRGVLSMAGDRSSLSATVTGSTPADDASSTIKVDGYGAIV
jgi:hypothetical protein